MLLFEAALVCDLVTLLVDDGVSIGDESRKMLPENDLDDREGGPKSRREQRSKAEKICFKGRRAMVFKESSLLGLKR